VEQLSIPDETWWNCHSPMFDVCDEISFFWTCR
jgi:hypothetical protein